MKFSEAMKLLEEGKKVRMLHWVNGEFISCEEFENPTESLVLGLTNAIDEEWELYEEEEQRQISFMAMIEELKKGKTFRRLGWNKFSIQKYENGYVDFCTGGKSIAFRVEDFEACDWIETK